MHSGWKYTWLSACKWEEDLYAGIGICQCVWFPYISHSRSPRFSKLYSVSTTGTVKHPEDLLEEEEMPSVILNSRSLLLFWSHKIERWIWPGEREWYLQVNVVDTQNCHTKYLDLPSYSFLMQALVFPKINTWIRRSLLMHPWHGAVNLHLISFSNLCLFFRACLVHVFLLKFLLTMRMAFYGSQPPQILVFHHTHGNMTHLSDVLSLGIAPMVVDTILDCWEFWIFGIRITNG